MARAAVAKADLLPDVTQLLSRTEDKAMIEAYIDQHCADNVKRELRAAARAAGDNDQVNVNIVWIKQEIAFALGVEVGRRIAGGAR